MTLDPARLVRDALPPLPPRRARVRVIAAGKAAVAMTAGALARWPDRIEGALVVTVPPLPDPADLGHDPRIEIRAAAHPVPDARSVNAAEEALRRAASLGTPDLLLALISGGASALLCAPPEGMSLAEKQALVAALLDRGVPIREVNLVRRHLSRIKGGRLALSAAPARVLTLMLSDVIGGEPHDVGSGPTVPDPTDVRAAREVLARAGIAEPPGLSESLGPGLVRTRARILAEPMTLARAVATELGRRGIAAVVDAPDEGDALAVVERRLARAAALGPGEAVVIACEPTLRLPAARGQGGRAGFVALAAMRRLPPGVVLLCAASDGVDGSSGAAGAIVSRGDGERIDGAAIDRALAGFDDASVHRFLGTHLPGGPSGQNLADVHVVARLER
jgi:hydroxypyruvate reductase